MRDNVLIWEAWKSGEYVGDTKFSTRVTVESSYALRTTSSVLGPWTRGPARWYQRYLETGLDDSEQHETEIPNIIGVTTNRSVDSDGGSLDLTLVNTAMPRFGAQEIPPGQHGDLGYFTWDHGQSQESKARWGHVVNEWNDVLVPNALLRTYQGFGGEEKAIHEALDDGNIVLNGVWLIDDVTITTDGTVQVKARDVASLLIDQQIYPPLVPGELYPLLYERYIIDRYEIAPDPPPGVIHEIINQPTNYGHNGPAPYSSTDVTYGGFDTGATGHPPSRAADWTPDPADDPNSFTLQKTYWLSEPKGSATDHVWIEFGNEVNDINIIYFHPWAGSYRVEVSVFENGGWVPPEGSGQSGIGPDGIPYVFAFTANWEGGQPPGLATNQYVMPRTYRSQRIRLTITNLVRAQEGGYRAGARMIIGQLDRTLVEYPRYSFASAALPYNTDNHTGYWQVRSNGRLFAFGDARVHDPVSPQTVHAEPVIAMNAHPSGVGYWTMDQSGRIVAYGAAQWFGDDEDYRHTDAMDFAVAPGGNGYWILHRDGTVHGFGAATSHGNSTPTGTMPSGAPVDARSIESHPATPGYWILWSDGTVDAHDLTHHGDASRSGYTDTEYDTCIRRTHDGGGYWIPSGGGLVQAFGNAPMLGNAPRYPVEQWARGLVWDFIPYSVSDNGYAVQYADGDLAVFGDFEFFGSFGQLYGELRRDGNYKDYADIVKELLLWSGFYLYKNPQPDTEFPEVYGNVESTGTYSKDKIAESQFDKHPVIEVIKWLKELVGYVFFIDAEGGARFESPNWWAMGNYLIDGTPFGYMPEIDESVQLMNHAITYSGQSARSELIISTEDPEPTVAGQTGTQGLTVTRITPPNAGDLKGKINPAMWTNGVFKNAAEQQILGDLISMQMWFARRTANISCVANPLIDVNDQVRVIERQTGETYIHYVRSINTTHDLASGDATMQLTTHWLGGSPYGQSGLYFTGDTTPLGDGYWQVNSAADIYAHGTAELLPRNDDDSHTEWVVAMRSTPTGEGYYTMDLSGKVLTYGDAEQHGMLFHSANDVIDMALTPTGHGYWLLTTDGTVHTFGDAVQYGSVAITGTMPSGSPILAEAIESHPSTNGYWILLSDGNVHAFNLPDYGSANRDGFTFTEYVASLRRTHDGGGYWVTSGSGIVQPFGNAPDLGNAAVWPDNYAAGLVWSILSNDLDGYALMRAGGAIEYFDFTEQGSSDRTLSDSLSWALMPADQYLLSGRAGVTLPVSVDLMKFLQNTGSPSANNAVTSNFGFASEPTIKADTDA